MPKILAIDIGTSRIKCALIGKTGKISFLADRRLPRAENPDTQDAVVWYRTVVALIRESTALQRPDAVSLTGNMHALLGVDASGTPLAPTRLWSDNSAQAESDALNQRFGPELLHRFGNTSIPVFTLPKLIREKALHRKNVKFLQSKDFIGFHLTGVAATDPTDASGVLGMLLDTKQWDEAFLQECGVDVSLLPEIRPSASFLGTVTPLAAKETGLLPGTPVVTGCGDLSSAALGSGTDADTFSLTLGTAGQLLGTGTPGSGRKMAGKIFLFAHADPAQELYLGSVPAGGFSFEYLAKLHRLSMEEFFAFAAEAPQRSAPLFHPYLLGRGAPYMDYTPCAAWLNLTAHHTPADLCRGAVAGVLSALRQCADLMEQYSGRRKRLILQALAAREQAVRHAALALFPQKEKQLPAESEASLLGAAIVGMAALNAYPSVGAAQHAMVRNAPVTETVAPELLCETRELYARYLDSVMTLQ